MSTLNLSVYAETCFSPTNPGTYPVTDLQKSGFTTLVLGLLHIGRDYDIKHNQIMGDIYFNDSLLISKGKYVGGEAWLTTMKGVPGGSLKHICAAVGGAAGPVLDFTTIQRIYDDNNNSFAGTNLETNFRKLRTECPFIHTIDMDCEDNYDPDSFVAFCEMLIGMGFGITFCPFESPDFWANSLAALQKKHAGAVKWWNLQCYSGGGGNTPQAWATAITNVLPHFDTNGFILAGDSSSDTVSGVQSLLSGFNDQAGLGGGFIWTLDGIIRQNPTDPLPNMQAYATAISDALTPTCFSAFTAYWR